MLFTKPASEIITCRAAYCAIYARRNEHAAMAGWLNTSPLAALMAYSGGGDKAVVPRHATRYLHIINHVRRRLSRSMMPRRATPCHRREHSGCACARRSESYRHYAKMPSPPRPAYRNSPRRAPSSVAGGLPGSTVALYRIMKPHGARITNGGSQKA